MNHHDWEVFITLMPKIQRLTEDGWIFEHEGSRMYAREKFYPERGSWHFDDFKEFEAWLNFIIRDE